MHVVKTNDITTPLAATGAGIPGAVKADDGSALHSMISEIHGILTTYSILASAQLQTAQIKEGR